MKLHKSANVNVEHNSETGVQIHRWTAATETMSNDTFKEEMYKIKEVVEYYKPWAVMVQAQNLNYILPPDVQEWNDINIVPAFLAAGVKKFAYVMPKDIFQQVALEQLMDEDNAKNFNTQYFDDETKGMEWLLKNKV